VKNDRKICHKLTGAFSHGGQVSAYCYNGECNTHQSQCRLWFGEEADNTVEDCYNYYNVLGWFGANCGINITTRYYIQCSPRYVRFGTISDLRFFQPQSRCFADST